MRSRILIGTRKSMLALWQTEHVKKLLENAFPGLKVETREIITRGDRLQGRPLPALGGKGLFTAELEEALVEEAIDIAVHSLKDLPTKMEGRFTLGAVIKRDSSHDVLISRDSLQFKDLPKGGVLGTSSLRRAAQIKRLRPDLEVTSIRGNVDSRIAKLHKPDSAWVGIVLAEAGVSRLGRGAEITQVFSNDEMLPAPAQGAMAVQCLGRRKDVLEYLKAIHCVRTFAEVSAERSFLNELNAGCSTPVAALAEIVGDKLSFRGRSFSPNGDRFIEVSGEDTVERSVQLGRLMAQRTLAQGFESLIKGE